MGGSILLAKSGSKLMAIDRSSILNEKDHENIKKAIEVQRKIDVRIKELREEIN